MTDSDRLDRLRLAQREIVARLDNPLTPSYSVAPLSNQLRLIEKEIARLTAHEDVDEGLPDPEAFGLVDALGFASWARGRSPSRRRPAGDFMARRAAIFESWKAAGFELLPRPESPDHAELEAWVEANRAELVRCLAAEEVVGDEA